MPQQWEKLKIKQSLFMKASKKWVRRKVKSERRKDDKKNENT